MPFSRKHGTWFWVHQKVMDSAKKRASKKNQFASESVREEDENDRTKAESHIHARAYDMTTSASNNRPKASSTNSEVSSIHPTESSMQCVETKASSTETKASPIASEAPSTSPNEIDDRVRKTAQEVGQNVDEIPHLDVRPIRE